MITYFVKMYNKGTFSETGFVQNPLLQLTRPYKASVKFN